MPSMMPEPEISNIQNDKFGLSPKVSSSSPEKTPFELSLDKMDREILKLN